MIKNPERRLSNGNLSLAGFTLIEILVVTVIFAVLSVAVFSSISLGVSVHNRITSSARLYKDAVIVLEKLEKELANSIEFAGIDFEGSAEQLEFCSIFDAATEEGTFLPTIGRLRYTFDSGEEVLLKEKYSFPQSLEEREESGEIIATGLKKVTFSYFNKDELTQEYEWSGQWEEEGVLPVGVRVEMYLSQDNGDFFEIAKTIFLPVALKKNLKEE